MYLFKDHWYFHICLIFPVPGFYCVIIFPSSPISKNSVSMRGEDPFVCDKHLFSVCHLSFAFCHEVFCHAGILGFSDEVFCHAGIPDFYKVRFSCFLALET